MIKQSTWEPRPNWLMLTPVTLPAKTEGGLHLPDTFTTKSNSGICVKAGSEIDRTLFLGQECLFPTHQEYIVTDEDNGQKYYIINSDHIIMVRKPVEQPKHFRVPQIVAQPTAPLTHSKTHD